MASNRESADEFLSAANDAAGDAKREDYSAASALIGIGYSLLEVADAIREGNGNQISMADFEAWYLRAAAAANRAPAAPEPPGHVAEHAGPDEPTVADDEWASAQS